MWSATNTAQPLDCNFNSNPLISCIESKSTPAKGSSSNKTLGLFIRHLAISTLRRSPPDKAIALTSLRCVIENSVINFSTISFFAAVFFITICAIANKFS